MADKKPKKSGKTRTARKTQPKSLEFGVENVIFGAAGLLCLTLGYWLLARGSITAAPLLLVLGYVVLLPMAIIR